MSPHYVGLATTNCDNSDQLSDHSLRKLPEHWSKRLYLVAWTTAVHFCMVYQTTSSRSCSLSRTLRHVSSLELDDVNTSPRCYASCTGFPSDNVSTLKSLVWHTSHCLVRHLSISRQTFNSSPTVVAVSSVQHLTGNASFHARRIPSATEVFASPDHACGTGFLGVSEVRTSATYNSDSS